MQAALHALYGHYEQTFEAWREAGIEVPPVFIVVCNNTSTSKLVYDFIAGFQRESDDSSTTLENGRLALFRNYDEHGNRLARPRTLLIYSEQLESGEALDKDFRETRWQTDPGKCHINWIVCDSDWEAEFSASPRATRAPAPTLRTRVSASKSLIYWPGSGAGTFPISSSGSTTVTPIRST